MELDAFAGGVSVIALAARPTTPHMNTAISEAEVTLHPTCRVGGLTPPRRTGSQLHCPRMQVATLHRDIRICMNVGKPLETLRDLSAAMLKSVQATRVLYTAMLAPLAFVFQLCLSLL